MVECRAEFPGGGRGGGPAAVRREGRREGGREGRKDRVHVCQPTSGGINQIRFYV